MKNLALRRNQRGLFKMFGCLIKYNFSDTVEMSKEGVSHNIMSLNIFRQVLLCCTM